MLLQNDIIPLGVSDGIISFIVNKNGLDYMPDTKIVMGKGNGNYWTVNVPVKTNADCVVLRLLGVSVKDIKTALDYNIK
jgi:hypothetical protein